MNRIICSEALTVLRKLPDDSVDLVLCSPPYGKQRSYGELDFKLTGEEYVTWAKERYLECVRVSRGLVAWVIEGGTKQFNYDATPLLLAADLKRAGVKLRKPPIYNRVGIPGSGGPDWLRNDYEFILCASKGRLPWSDNKACGSPPKYKPGGAPSHRNRKGERVNKGCRGKAGKRDDRERDDRERYKAPKIANPGNVIRGSVGGGAMGSDLANENEAPYPEWLASFFVRSFCPPGGIVLDTFGGSGTTAAVAVKNGRRFISVDVRENQTELTRRRVAEAEDVWRRSLPCCGDSNCELCGGVGYVMFS